MAVKNDFGHESRVLEREPCPRAKQRTQGRLARCRCASPGRRRQGGRDEETLWDHRKGRHPLPHLHDHLPHQLPECLAERPSHLSPPRTRGERDRRTELATCCGLFDLEHLGEPTAAGMAPCEVAGDVGTVSRDLRTGQPHQKIHLVLYSLAPEQLSHAIGVRGPLTRGALVEEAQRAPAIRASAHVLFGLATLVGRRAVALGLLGDRIEQDRDRLVVIHRTSISLVARNRARAPGLGVRPVDARRTRDVSAARRDVIPSLPARQARSARASGSA